MRTVKPDRPVLFYDQDCRFCRASARAIEFLDRKHLFALLPFSDPAADELLSQVEPADRERSIHVVEPDGWVVSAGDALIELTRVLPAGGYIADAVWREAPLRRIFRWGYQAVADNRSIFSRLVPNYAPPVRRPQLR